MTRRRDMCKLPLVWRVGRFPPSVLGGAVRFFLSDIGMSADAPNQPEEAMSDIVKGSIRELADLVALIAVAAWVAPKLHLYSNDLTPSPETLLADLTEVTSAGVVAQTATYGTPYVDANGVAVVSGGEIVFTQTGAPNETAYGCYLTNTAGTVLLWSARFDAPFNFTGVSVLALTFKMSLPGGLVDVADLP